MQGVCLSKDEASLNSKLSVTIKEILSVEKKPIEIEDNIEKSAAQKAKERVLEEIRLKQAIRRIEKIRLKLRKQPK